MLGVRIRRLRRCVADSGSLIVIRGWYTALTWTRYVDQIGSQALRYYVPCMEQTTDTA